MNTATSTDKLSGGSETKVLLVDGDPTAQKVLISILSEMGCTVETSRSGYEALHKAGKGDLDLILLDLALTKTTSQTVLEDLRAVDSNVPIIVMTANGSTKSAVKFLEDGAVDYLIKPPNPKEFRIRVQRALDERRAALAAIMDPTTGLFNRAHFEKRLGQELNRAQRYGHEISLLMLDVDDFEEYNESCGDIAGDAVLVQIGKHLDEIKRDSDIPCRFGGGVFCMILPETDSSGAFSMAERIRNNIERMIFDKGKGRDSRKVTVSIGVASCKPERDARDQSIDPLIEDANDALYDAKRLGKNYVCLADGSERQMGETKKYPFLDRRRADRRRNINTAKRYMGLERRASDRRVGKEWRRGPGTDRTR